MAGRTTPPAPARAVRRRPFRSPFAPASALLGVLLALLLALPAGLPPAATASAARSVPSAPASAASPSSASGAEVHEDLHPTRGLSRPAPPRLPRPVAGHPPVVSAALAPGTGMRAASTPVEALPRPLDLLPVDRN